MTEDTPAPVDADQPPPRRRGLGRGLADLRHTAYRVDTRGQNWTPFDALTRGILRADEARLAERTQQPVALHRLPEPATTGELSISEILGARTAPPVQRTMGEAAAWLNQQLANPSTAIRVREDVEPVAEPEPVAEVAQEKRSKWADLDEL